MSDPGFTFAELCKCAGRELAQRRRVYPRLVASEKMSQKIADREIAMMSAIAEYFEAKDQPKLL
jgi:hypothetical protein